MSTLLLHGWTLVSFIDAFLAVAILLTKTAPTRMALMRMALMRMALMKTTVAMTDE